MAYKRYRIFGLCCLMIVAIAGCDSTDGNNSNNLQLTLAAEPTSVLVGEFSSITATVNRVDTSVSTGTSTTTTTPVAGYAVTFSISQNVSKGTLTAVDTVTDTSGMATAIYQAGSTTGIDIIAASIDTGQIASASVTVN